LGFLIAFIERMLALVRTTRVTGAGASGKTGDAGGFGATVFAIIVRHGGDVLVVVWVELRFDGSKCNH